MESEWLRCNETRRDQMNLAGNHAVARMFQVSKCLAALIRRMKRVTNGMKQRASLTGEQEQADQGGEQGRMRCFDDRCIFHVPERNIIRPESDKRYNRFTV